VSDLETTFAAPDFYAKPRAEIFDFKTQLEVAHLTRDLGPKKSGIISDPAVKADGRER